MRKKASEAHSKQLQIKSLAFPNKDKTLVELSNGSWEQVVCLSRNERLALFIDEFTCYLADPFCELEARKWCCHHIVFGNL